MEKVLKSKEQVLQDFKALVAARKIFLSRITTKEETAREEANKQLAALASQYTTDTIVKGLANLQLSFSGSIEQLSEELQKEFDKLNEIRTAIKVEQAHLNDSANTKIAADVLYILRQEQAAKMKTFGEEKKTKWKTIEDDTKEKRIAWEKERANNKSYQEEYIESLKRSREKELEEYRYSLERKYLVEKDDHDKRKKLLIRELGETQQTKDKNWTAREKVLAENADKFKEYKEKVDNFDTELKEATSKAKDKAMKAASKAAKVKANLFEKDVIGKKRIAELQIESLEGVITEHNTRIEKLSAELKEALAQVQALSIKALENSSKKGK